MCVVGGDAERKMEKGRIEEGKEGEGECAEFVLHVHISTSIPPDRPPVRPSPGLRLPSSAMSFIVVVSPFVSLYVPYGAWWILEEGSWSPFRHRGTDVVALIGDWTFLFICFSSGDLPVSYPFLSNHFHHSNISCFSKCASIVLFHQLGLPPPFIGNPPQSASWLSTLMLRIMTSRPMVTMMSSVKENQPRTMALVPTPDLTLPLAKSSAMVLAATEAVCCHRTETSTKMEAMKMMARATCDTGRLGKGFTSRSDPSLSSSSCQPGKVARRRKQMKAKMMAMILDFWSAFLGHGWVSGGGAAAAATHMRYGNTMESLNWLASQMRLRGSWSTETSWAREVALLEHSQLPPSGLMQMPK